MHTAVQRSMIVAVLLVFYCGQARAAERQLRLDWNDLPAYVSGRRISTVLTDGTGVEGRVVSVKPDALSVEIKKTSDPARFHGTADVPRQALSAVRVSRPGWKWRVILPITGFFALGILGGVIGNHIDPHGFIVSDGGAKGATVGVVTGAAGGFIAGYYLDHHTVSIEILR